VSLDQLVRKVQQAQQVRLVLQAQRQLSLDLLVQRVSKVPLDQQVRLVLQVQLL
jgi:hypothetical protein